MITMLVISIIILIKCTTSEIHTTYSIADERMKTSIYCLTVTKILREVKVLTCQYSFTSYIVRIHTFPTSRNCTSVEYHFKSIVIGIRQNSFIYLHHHLLVTTEEINLYTFYTSLLHPFHLFFAQDWIIHYPTWRLKSIIPITIRIIPKIQRNALFSTIFSKFCNLV